MIFISKLTRAITFHLDADVALSNSFGFCSFLIFVCLEKFAREAVKFHDVTFADNYPDIITNYIEEHGITGMKSVKNTAGVLFYLQSKQPYMTLRQLYDLIVGMGGLHAQRIENVIR